MREKKLGTATRILLLLGSVAAAVLLAAACGGGDEAATTEAPATEPATTEAPASSEASADTGAAAASGQIQASDVVGGVDVSAESGDQPLKLAFFGLCACNPYTASEAEGVKKAVAALGNDSTYTFFDGKFDPQVQVNQVQDATASGKYNAYVILPNDSASIVPAVEEAVSKGIKVGALTFPIGPDYTITDKAQVDGVVMSLVNNPVTDGEVTGAETNRVCEGKDPCNTVVMMGDRTISWEAERLKSLEATFDPNVKVVHICDAGFLQEQGFNCMQDALQIEPEIDVVMTPSGDEMLTGAQSFLKSKGIAIGDENTDGKFQFVGLGASTDAVKQIQAGLWHSSRVFLGDPTIDTIVVQALADHVNGRGDKWPEAFNTDDVSPIGPIVTPETLAETPDFKGEWCC